MLQLSEKAKRLYDLLFTKEFSLKLLKNELESGAWKSASLINIRTRKFDVSNKAMDCSNTIRGALNEIRS